MRTDLIGRTATSMPKRHQLADFVPAVVQDMRMAADNPTPATVSVSPSATANTKGAWVELFAATSAPADIIQINANGTSLSGSAGGALADIGIGAASSEVVVVPNVSIGNRINSSALPLFLPVSIPQGSRVAIRWQSNRASASASPVEATLLRFPASSGIRVPTKLEDLNADTATSVGTASSTSNTWIQVTASAPNAYQGFIVTPGSNDSVFTGIPQEVIDIGVGASGAERACGGQLLWLGASSETYGLGTVMGVFPSFYALPCPKGARVAFRWRGSSVAATTTVVVQGVPYA